MEIGQGIGVGSLRAWNFTSGIGVSSIRVWLIGLGIGSSSKNGRDKFSGLCVSLRNWFRDRC